MDKLPEFEKVKVSCTASDCDNDKHCFRPKRGQWKDDSPRGVCRKCGDDSVNVAIPRNKGDSDLEDIFRELDREFIRHTYFNKPIDKDAARRIKKRGVQATREEVGPLLAKKIGREPNAFDGRQTPLAGNIINYAQHATATCCRKCAYYWYAIPKTGELSSEDLAFCESLVQAYLDQREDELTALVARQ